MQSIFVCIGNGLHDNGTPSNISTAIVDKVLERQNPRNPLTWLPTLFSGGYRNSHGITEADSMHLYALRQRPELARFFRIESNSYRTHNNALEALSLITRLSPNNGAVIYIIDHPLHIERTTLCFKTVARLYHRRLNLIFAALPAREVYDSEIPGQEYWISREKFWARELQVWYLYKFLLWWPWARFGLWLLRKIWPSHKQ